MLDALFGWWQYDFMRNAFVAVLLIMPLFALLGTLVVNNGMAFFSDALGHSALTGVGIGVLDVYKRQMQGGIARSLHCLVSRATAD